MLFIIYPFDTGQIELYTHMPVMRQLIEILHQWNFRVCGVFLIDSQFVVDCSKFFAGVLTALSAMIQLEIPHINVMSKMDLLSKKQLKEIDRWVDYKSETGHSQSSVSDILELS